MYDRAQELLDGFDIKDHPLVSLFIMSTAPG
jgi:hypothetical protein